MKKILPVLLLGTYLIYAEQNSNTVNEDSDSLALQYGAEHPVAIPPAKETHEESKFSVHGHYRGRIDSYNGVNKLAYGDDAIDAKGDKRGKSDDLIYLQQIIFGFDYQINDEWEMKAYMYDSRAWGSSLTPEDFTKNTGTQDEYVMSYYEDHLELFEAYIRKHRFLYEDLTLTLGRQQLGYGDRRIFGPGKWGNTMGWLWDAAHLSYKQDKNYLDVWYGQTRTKDPDDFSIVEKHRYQGVGMYGHYEIDGIKIEPFAAWRNNLHHDVKSQLDYYYAGARVFDLRPGFIYDATGIIQTGTFDSSDVKAYAYVLKGGYKLDNLYQSTFMLGYVYASGDEDPNDDKMQTFTAPFGANDGLHYGRMDLMVWANMHDMQAKLSMIPIPKMKLQLEYHHFNLADANDKWYFLGYKNKPGNSYTHVGDEIDMIAKYKLTKAVDLLGIYGYFKAGDFITKNNIAQNNASKLFLQFMYKW